MMSETGMASQLFDVTGRTAAVTGAARGLGRTLAEGLAAQGAHVVVGDLNEPGARDTAARINAGGGQASAMGLDVSDRRSCEAFVQHSVRRFGQLDILVNNAAVDVLEPIEDISEDSWARVIGVDLSGVLFMSQAAIRHWLDRHEGGSIINITSIASEAAIPKLASYSAAKGGVSQLTRVMAVELAQAGIRVNAIAPGYLENVMEGATAEHADPQTEHRIQSRTPMARRARLDEMVGPVVFLASEAASFMTGAILFVDGGYTAA